MKNNGILAKIVATVFAVAFIFVIGNNTASASEGLTQGQKEALYKQYVEILNEVKSTVEWGATLTGIEVAPISKFDEENDWVSPEVFKQRAIDATQASIVPVPVESTDIMPLGTDSATHKFTVTHRNTDVNISMSATFTTHTSNGRQVFSNYSNLKIVASKGDWFTTGTDARIIDGGRTYTFTVGGGITYVGLNSYHTLNTDFLCSVGGGVS